MADKRVFQVLIACEGSRGDIQPYIALGRAIQPHGYDVTFAANCRFRELVKHYGIKNFIPLDGEQDEKYLDTILVNLIDKYTVEGVVDSFKEAYFQMFPRLAKRWEQIFQERKYDAALFSPGGGLNIDMFAYVMAKKYNVPVMANMPLQPQYPTNDMPPIFYKVPEGCKDNRSLYRNITDYNWKVKKELILTWLDSIGFEFDKSRNLLEDLLYDPTVYVINGYSPKLAPPPSDAAPNMKTVGFFWTDNLPESFKPSDKLEKFLQNGEPPLYIGFGSMRCDNPTNFTAFTIEALRELNVRAILCEGWGSIRKPEDWDENAPENENILFVSDIPHSYLFPRCKAAIVHGGAGTTSYALRAGLPVQIVPFLSDQPFWGGRIEAAGVGLAPIPASKLSKALLIDRIPKLLNDPSLHENAKNMAQELASDRPFEAILEILDTHLRHSVPNSRASESKLMNEVHQPVSIKIPA